MVLFFAIVLVIVSFKVTIDEVRRINEAQSEVEDFEEYRYIQFDESVINIITVLLIIAVAMIIFSIFLFYFALFARSEEYDKLNDKLDQSNSRIQNLENQMKTIYMTSSKISSDLSNLKNSLQMEFDLTMSKMGNRTHTCPYCQGRASLIDDKELIYQCISCRSRYQQFGENYIKI
ncbi:MAG: hypothetical protein ACMUHY_05310 [Thermoplasmatota archaeon]